MDSFTLIIFGITSNLAQLKLIPALYDIVEKDLLPQNASIIGVARQPKTETEFKKFLDDALHIENRHHNHRIKPQVLEKLSRMTHYLDGNLDDAGFYLKLKKYLAGLGKSGIESNNRIFYLATYPDLYSTVFENLKASGLNSQEKGWTRLMVEKPIGNDLPSAKKLNNLLLNYFSEDQIYRLDHYLGKQTLQNILTFRFSNDIFETLASKEHIDHIQITASEDFGVGKRGGYYDKVGALKDVGQNHQLQMLAFATMEKPTDFTNQAITSQRIKILKQLVAYPEKIVFGQYQGYTEEANVEKNSTTDTFYALKTQINNDRFAGVPIYIRAGKKLTQTAAEISVVFKKPVSKLFNSPGSDLPNVLIYRLDPNEGIVLRVQTKKPGAENSLGATYMQYCYPHASGHYLPDAYERLLLDAIRGDQTFFNDSAEVEAEWEFIDPLFEKRGQPLFYNLGTWGPKQADGLIEADGRKWLEPSMEFCNI